MGTPSPPRRSRRRWAALAIALVGLAVGSVAVAAEVVSPTDLAGTRDFERPANSLTGASTSSFTTSELCLASGHPGTLFDFEPGGFIGADYQRSIQLPDGRTLWTFQDAAWGNGAGGFRVVHNIGAIQDGPCYRLLVGGSPTSPRSWLFTGDTAPGSRWFWPLDAAIGADGDIYGFMAEMREFGDEYLDRTEPMGTFVAGVDADTLAVDFLGRPSDASPALYGWSITSDHAWTYLYAQCHRQFGYDPWIFELGHDLSCAAAVTLARVPRGFVFDRPEYWDGARWTPDPTRAAAVFSTSGRLANPVDVVFHNNRFHAVTKVHDWWGDEIIVERADRPFGSFETVARWIETPKCPVDCNTYYASFSASTDPDVLLLGLSHNRWDGVPTSFYRPTFRPFTVPASQPRPADRCAADHCD
ncbi:MAG: hypothetical protein AAGD33_05800 [Actinomycetota bacterium]